MSLCCDLGDDVRRYLSGPPGPQGPPGLPGTSVGISASYSVEEIATYVFNIMNGKHRSQKTETLTLEVEPGPYQSNCCYCHFQIEGLLEVCPGHLVLLGLLVQGPLALPLRRLTILH